MKLRIKGNSLRLRLSRSEVAQFASVGAVEDQMRLDPLQKLLYRVQVVAEQTTPTVSLDQNTLTVKVSHSDVHAWAVSNLVGIYGRQAVGNGETLEIALEKDFACLERRLSDEDKDSFPNPSARR